MEPIVYQIKDSSRTYWKITVLDTGFTEEVEGVGEDKIWDVTLCTDDPCAQYQFSISDRIQGQYDIPPDEGDVLYHFGAITSSAFLDLMNCKKRFHI
jgi:hypothetical protein